MHLLSSPPTSVLVGITVIFNFIPSYLASSSDPPDSGKLMLIRNGDEMAILTKTCHSGVFLAKPQKFDCACINGVWAFYSKFCEKPVMLIGGKQYCFRIDKLQLRQVAIVGSYSRPFAPSISHFQDTKLTQLTKYISEHELILKTNFDASGAWITITNREWTLYNDRNESICLKPTTSTGKPIQIICKFATKLHSQLLRNRGGSLWSIVTKVKLGCHSNWTVKPDTCYSIKRPNGMIGCNLPPKLKPCPDGLRNKSRVGFGPRATARLRRLLDPDCGPSPQEGPITEYEKENKTTQGRSTNYTIIDEFPGYLRVPPKARTKTTTEPPKTSQHETTMTKGSSSSTMVTRVPSMSTAEVSVPSTSATGSEVSSTSTMEGSVPGTSTTGTKTTSTRPTEIKVPVPSTSTTGTEVSSTSTTEGKVSSTSTTGTETTSMSTTGTKTASTRTTEIKVSSSSTMGTQAPTTSTTGKIAASTRTTYIKVSNTSTTEAKAPRTTTRRMGAITTRTTTITTRAPPTRTTEEPPREIRCDGLTRRSVMKYWLDPANNECARSISEAMFTDQLRRYAVTRFNKVFEARLKSLEQMSQLLQHSKNILKKTCGSGYVPSEFFDVAADAFLMFIQEDFFYGAERMEPESFERIVESLKKCWKRAKLFVFETEPLNCDLKKIKKTLIMPGKTVNITIPPNAKSAHFEILIETSWKMFLNAHSYCFEDFLVNDHHQFSIQFMELFSRSIYQSWIEPLQNKKLYKFIIPHYELMREIMENVDYCVAAAGQVSQCPVWLQRSSPFAKRITEGNEVGRRRKRSTWEAERDIARAEARMWDGKGYCVQRMDEPASTLQFASCKEIYKK